MSSQSLATPLVTKTSLATFSIKKTLKDKKIMIIGGTGFLGRVMLYTLLKFVPNIGKIYVAIRPTHSLNANDRFYQEVLKSPVFTNSQEDIDFFSKICPQNVEVVEMEASQPSLGLSPSEYKDLSKNLDVILNTAGLVEFNPPIDTSLIANTIATQKVLEFVASSKCKKYVHISTAYVGNLQKYKDFLPEEALTIKDTLPKTDMPSYIEKIQSEIQEIKKYYSQKQNEISSNKDSSSTKDYIQTAQEELRRIGKKDVSQKLLEKTAKNLISLELREQLIQLGKEKAKNIGRPNVYTFTKSLAELLVNSYQDQIKSTIIRPSIVESALQHPFPGWNEGIQGTAPLLYLALKGHRMFPFFHEDTKIENNTAILDCIPVDEVASGTILGMCALLQNQHKNVYQLTAGEINPKITVSTFSHLAGNLRKQEKFEGKKLVTFIQKNAQPFPATLKQYNRFSTPRTLKMLTKIRKRLDTLSKKNFSKESSDFVDAMRSQVEKFYQISNVKHKIFQEFLPFIYKGYPPFANQNAKNLHASLVPEEKNIFHFNPCDINYLDYLSNLHYEALKKWIFPVLDKRFQAIEKITRKNNTFFSESSFWDKSKSLWKLTKEWQQNHPVNPITTNFSNEVSEANNTNKVSLKKSENQNSVQHLSKQLQALNHGEAVKNLKEKSSIYLEKLSQHIEFLYGARIHPTTLQNLDTIVKLEKHISTWLEENPHKKNWLPKEGKQFPDSISEPGTEFLYKIQMSFYRRYIKPKIHGKENIPLNNNQVLLVANHSSHLDYGLVWYALGKYSRHMSILAAKDYFFDRFWKSTFFGNFLNLIPIERNSDSYAKALAPVLDFLHKEANPLLIFPEGTRSTDNQIQEFRLGLGYLIKHSKMNVLPLRLLNTGDVLPKGNKFWNMNKNAKVEIHIGSLLKYETLIQGSEKFSPTKTYKDLSQKVFHAVQNL